MTTCDKCGNELNNSTECVNCTFQNDPFEKIKKEHKQYMKKERSKAWIILPIILGLIGGVIALVILWRDDKKLAKICLLLGIMVTILLIFLNHLSQF